MRNRMPVTGLCWLVWFAAATGLPAAASARTPQEQVLYRFAGGNDGAEPNAGPIADDRGNLYGTTSEGGGAGCGGYGCGTVFELSPQQGGVWTEAILHKFQGGTDGEDPNAPLIADGAGRLYGTTLNGGSNNCGSGSGCGTVFRLSSRKDGWKEEVLYSFTTKSHEYGRVTLRRSDVTKPDVWSPSGLVFGSDRNLYGFASLGGRCEGNGVLVACFGGAFELAKPTAQKAWREKVVYRGKNLLHGGPEGPPVFDAGGKLYGLEVGANYGSVFRLQPTAGKALWSPSTLYTFQGGSDGGYPAPGLVFDASGNLYGATTGYMSLPGNVFELTPEAQGRWSETPLYTFANSAGGETPSAAPVLSADGTFYGLTEAGGQNNLGVAYELSPQKSSWNETVLYSFAGGSDGATPQGSLLLDNGALFGATLAGGSGGCFDNTGCGTVFEIMP